MTQTIILLTSAISIYFLSIPKLRLCGLVTTLCAQPLWLYDSYNNGQWGIFILSCWYIIISLNGIFNNDTK